MMIAAGCLTAGCATIDEIAPPIDPRNPRTGAQTEIADQMLARLEYGRQLYLTDCAACHSPEPVTRYSRARWNDTLPRMAREARLNAEQESAVAAYIDYVLERAAESAAAR